MSESLPEDAWVNCFLPTPPRPLISALQRRLQASTTHLNALAELYKQRAAIEATYADSLAKLARTAEQGGLHGKNSTEWDKGSGEARLWDTVVAELSETSTSHSTLSALIRTDFEQPIRDLPNKIVAWRRITEQDASLDKTLKEYEKTSAKLEKASGKKSSKADTLSSELDQLTALLSSLSPMVYTTYQRLDEERLKGLKEVIVRWGTVRADISTKDGERAERSVAGVLGWEPGDEVLAVGTRLGGLGGGRAGTAPSISAASTPRTNRRMSSATGGTGSDFSPRPSLRQNGSSTNVSQPPSSFGGGFKSMLGRTKTLAGNRGRSGSNATSVRSGRDREAGFDTIGEEGTRNTGSTSAPPVDDEGFSVAPADRHRNPWDEPEETLPTPALQPAPATAPPSATFAQTFSSPNGSRDDLSITSQNQQPRLNLAMAPKPIQETEEERQAALQKMQQALQLPPSQPSRRSTIARGRRDVRNTMFAGAGDDPVAAFGGLGKVTRPSVAETLNEEAGFPFNSTTETSNRDGERPVVLRQGSMNSIGSRNPFETPALGAGLPSAAVPPAISASGLRASLVETVNAITRNGEVQRLQINGEVHLSLRKSADTATGPIHIRLISFEQLEKIAPNPAYLAQVPDKPGEYFLNAEVLAGVTSEGPSKGTLLFKYQVHVPPGQESALLPLVLDPAFMCKDGETRMILNYHVNTASPVYQALSSATFHDLSLLAAFGPGPSVSNVQAKPPGGIWSPANRRMKWELNDFSGTEGKIIARFTTEPGEPMLPQGVQASWALEGILGSGLDIEVVGGEIEGHEWKFEEVKKGLTTGKYLAEPKLT